MENKMKEFKVKYNHDKARKVLEGLGLQSVKEEILEDFYLIDDDKDIYKLARVDGQLKLAHLINEGDGFKVMLVAINDGQEQQELARLFDNSKQVMRKERKHYQWRDSVVVLDKVEKLGEFIEFYPASVREKLELFKAFEISDGDLITESYHSLWLRQ